MNGDNQMSSNPGGSGSLIGSIIVVVILIIGAIYLFSSRTSAPTTAPVAPEVTAPAPVVETTPAAPTVPNDNGASLESSASSTMNDSANLEVAIGNL